MTVASARPSRNATGARRLVALLAALLLVVAACGGDDGNDDATGDDAAAGGTAGGGDEDGGGEERSLVIVRDMDLNSLDPSRAYCDTCQIYLTATYETLIGLDDDNKTFIPRLATSWETNEDATEFTFTLDPAATFADGSPVEAKDVKWSWERLTNVQGSASYFTAGLTSIETPDEATVVATFEAPNSAFLAIVNAPYMSIVNSDLASENGAIATEDAATADEAEQWFLANSAGSGPFTLASYQEGAELRLARNDDYWRDPADFPEVIMTQTQDAVSQRQQLESGAADIAMQISNDVAADMESGGDITVEQVASFNYVYIAFSPGAEGTTVEMTPEVLEALRLAIDYDGVIDVTVGGAGKKQASPIPNGFLGSEGLPLPEQDLERSRELLEAAGLGDGFALDATYPALNVYGVDFTTMMQKVQSDLAEVGVDAQLTPIDISVWAEQIGAGGIPLTAVYFAPDHTDSSQYVQYFGMTPGSSWASRAGGGEEIVNPAEAELLAEALATADVDARAAIYEQLGEEMIEDGVIVPLVNPDLFLAYASDIGNMHYSACCNLELGKLTLGG
jgi:peptide/nickel transport system substrate-binding protein